MATLYLTEQQSLVKKEGDTLLVQIPENKTENRPKKKVRVPLIKIDRVVVQGNSTLTSPAIAALMERRAEVTFLNQYGRFQGHLSPAYTKNGQLRLAQVQTHHNPAQAHSLNQAFVTGKLHNMRTMLMRFNRKHKLPKITAAVAAIKQNIQAVKTTPADADTPDPSNPQTKSAYGRLQGLEGSGTAHYFNCFKSLLNDPKMFNGRTRRPPRDPVNALLSYGYTILLNQMTSAIYTVGLDPYIGYLHRSRFGKPALALDLMEEFRPLIVDSVVISIFNNKIIKPHQFIKEFGTYRLTKNGRRIFLTKLEARFDEAITHPTFDYKTTYRRSLELQVRLLAKYLLGEIPTYPPMLIR
ncbi:MAG: type I-D CRISPR-associated endonuclease Cas1 [Anaerolineales bacterium]|nr:type I-D CRISPR-associated endonuclease Cas1 [Anaerolineales bacterium]